MNAAAAAGPSALTSASSSGQSTTTDASAARPSGVEKQFHQMIQLYKQCPKFLTDDSASAVAAAKLAVDAAFADSMNAYDAKAYKATPEYVIKAIQAGKLPAVGLAIPKPITASLREDGVAHGNLTLDPSTGELRSVGGELKAPLVASAAEFARALVSTILPALVAQPTAASQWLALARTVLEVDRKYGWDAARTYLDQLLQNRVPSGQDIATVDLGILASIMVRGAAAGGRGPQLAQPLRQQPPSLGPKVDGVCRDYNNGRCTRGALCAYAHTCEAAAMGAGCAGDPPHPRHACRFAGQFGGRGGGARHGSGGKGPRPPRAPGSGSSAASVVSTVGGGTAPASVASSARA
jgi:hypothetical protein